MERMALTIARGLRVRGHEIFVVASGWNDGEFLRHLDSEGIPHIELHLGKLSKSLRPQPVAWTLDTLRHLPRARRKLREHLTSFAPDVVIAYNRDWLLLARSILKRQRTVFHAHELPVLTRASRMTYRALSQTAKKIVAASQYVAQRFEELGVSHEQTFVIYNGVEAADDSAFAPSATRQLPPAVGIIGQVAPWKGYDDLIEALAILSASGVQFRCIAFGSGADDYQRMLNIKAEALGVRDLITWKGYVSDPRQAFEQMDLCVVPSRVEESFGLVAVEAALNQLPVVAARSGALEEIVIDGVTGFVVAPADPAALAARLQALIESPELRASLGTAARKHAVERFRASRMVDSFEDLCVTLARA